MSLIIAVSDAQNPAFHAHPQLSASDRSWQGSFDAMASDCQVLMEGVDQQLAEKLLRAVAIETWRIEFKFSRYRQDNTLASINGSNGSLIQVDQETASLLDFANQCYQLSEGLFDITSGVLRKIWRFDGSDRVPAQQQIEEMRQYIGWHKVSWHAPELILPEGMELDLGGLGKEYAVDRALWVMLGLVRESGVELGKVSLLVNFGGDLACSGARLNQQPWKVAIEGIDNETSVAANVTLSSGALATSGDVNRYLLKDGVRYSHILNPKTACSVQDAPHSVSVAAKTCMQAGMLSTMAMLHGEKAEAFLDAQELEYWVQR